jgi:hypothetical protein
MINKMGFRDFIARKSAEHEANLRKKQAYNDASQRVYERSVDENLAEQRKTRILRKKQSEAKKLQSENFWGSRRGRALSTVGMGAKKSVPYVKKAYRFTQRGTRSVARKIKRSSRSPRKSKKESFNFWS